MLRLFSKLFLILGLFFILFGFYLVYLRNSPKPLAFKSKPATVVALSKETPLSVEIPSIKVNLPIIPATGTGKFWETTYDGVSYLATSPLPGHKGNSILYGHNWKSLLLDLPKVKPGQSVFITNHNGTKQRFIVEYTAVVDPSQTYIIDATNDTRITLYTCTGFLDSKRFVVVAKPLI